MARFIRTKDNKLFDTEFYGIETWGLNVQVSIEEESDGNYYFHHWVGYYDSYLDDRLYKEKIEVVKASDNIEDVVDEIKDNVAFINEEIVAIMREFEPDDKFRNEKDWEVI